MISHVDIYKIILSIIILNNATNYSSRQKQSTIFE